MSAKEKNRAPRNRTLRVSEEEIPSLEAMISSIDELKKGVKERMIVNADLFQCLDLIPDESFDLIIIDPPYNLSKTFSGLRFSAMDSVAYETYLRSWFGKVCDKLSPSGSLYMCGDWQCSSSMQRVIEERLIVLNRITWQREKGRGAAHNWKNGMEDIWFAVKNVKDYYFDVNSVKVKRKVRAPYREGGSPKDWEQTSSGNFRITYPSNFWDDISIPFWSMPENTDHPTQKPEKLYAKLILASSKQGDRIFDPFMGSGTSAVVAEKLGRRFLGVEISKEYCLWAAKRLNTALSDKTIQGYVDGVFWERNSLLEQKKR
ncbi:MAG: site-specific DNA-methyltransferase [Alistipes sp.]|nr:site-specific DNA-methyltransferase [Candidatus Alistipes equi]